MSELNYRCPKCGQDEHFYASAVTGCGHNLWDVTEDGIVERHNGGGNEWAVSDTSLMACAECGCEMGVHHFRKPSFDACPKCGSDNVEYGNVYAEGGLAWHDVTCLECGNKYALEYEFKTVDWEEA